MEHAAETPLARVVREQGRVQRWLAEHARVDETRLSRLLSGERRMHAGEAVRLARVLGVPVEDIVPGGGS